MPSFVFFLISLSLSPAQSRAESLLSFELRDSISAHGELVPGDRLLFPNDFQLENFSEQRGFAATLVTGRLPGGKAFGCAFSLPAISEVKFTSDVEWHLLEISSNGEVSIIRLTNDQFGSDREMELRCTSAESLKLALAKKGVKLLEPVPVEWLDGKL